MGAPVHSHGLMHGFMFLNRVGHPLSVTACHPTPVISSHLLSPRLQWPHLYSDHDTPKIIYNVHTLILAIGVKMKI